VGENIHRSRTTISRSHTGRNMRGREEVKTCECRVWTETVKDEERICEGKPVSDLSLIIIIIIISSLSLLLILTGIAQFLSHLIAVILINYSAFLLA